MASSRRALSSLLTVFVLVVTLSGRGGLGMEETHDSQRIDSKQSADDGHTGQGRSHHNGEGQNEKFHVWHPVPWACEVRNTTNHVVHTRACPPEVPCSDGPVLLTKGNQAATFSFCAFPFEPNPSVACSVWNAAEEEVYSSACLIGSCDAGPVLFETLRENLTLYFCNDVPSQRDYGLALLQHSCAMKTSSGEPLQERPCHPHPGEDAACPVDGAQALHVPASGSVFQAYFCNPDYPLEQFFGTWKRPRDRKGGRKHGKKRRKSKGRHLDERKGGEDVADHKEVTSLRKPAGSEQRKRNKPVQTHNI